MRPHELTIFQLHVVLGAGPRFFVPPIPGKKKGSDLIDDLSANFVALKMLILRNKNGGVRRRPKSSERRFSFFFCGGSRPGCKRAIGVNRPYLPRKILHPERIRPMRLF